LSAGKTPLSHINSREQERPFAKTMSDNSQACGPERRRSLLPVVIGDRLGGIAVACALAAIGLLFAWQASLLDLGGVGLPGPGFFPLLTGGALTAFAIMIAIELLRSSGERGSVAFGHRDVLIVFAALLAVPLLFEPLGAYGTLGLFGALMLVLIARTSALVAAGAAAIAMAMCWYFFEELLGLQLPSAPW
jgi:hypothetical protein